MEYAKLRKEVLKANLELVKHNLVIFTWGNVSAIDREKGIVAIKPSGVEYAKLKAEDIVVLDLNGNIIDGKLRPSSDTNTHLELYRRFKEIGSIVHTHSTYATVFAQAGFKIKCLGTTHADYFYGSVPVARELKEEEMKDYELNTGKVIVEKFNELKFKALFMPACLTKSHGPFVWGKNCDNAIHNAVVLEEIAKMNYLTHTLNTDITPLKKYILDKHYQRKNGKNAYYGQK